jgi:serine/threonine-protein kinase
VANANADCNLLFGILAWQMDFISRDALLDAMKAWVFDKARPLGQILLQQGALRPDTQQLIESLVQKHLELHDNDPEKSLAAVSSVGSLCTDLEELNDAELQTCVGFVSAAHAEDPYATRAGSVGMPTSTGQRFRILRPHAKGGLGEVHVAHDEELRREVAVKEIQDRYADDPKSRARFLLEAKITGGLEHPGVVPVYGLGQYADGRPFYAMRFIRGDSLKEAIAAFHAGTSPHRTSGEQALALRQLLGRFVDVCNAVAFAHSRGVLHRDLKPGNVMLGKYGETLVVDWGLAKPLKRTGPPIQDSEGPLVASSASGSSATLPGQAIGTPAFMSPEQAKGQIDQLGPASDIYSLGATLYALLTGHAPAEGPHPDNLLTRVATADWPKPRQINKEIPTPLEAICLKAMALRPDDRYPSALALAADVEHWLGDEPVTAYPEPWPTRAARWMRKHRAAVTTLMAALVLALVFVTAVALLVQHQKTEMAHKNEELASSNKREREAAELAQKTIEDMTSDKTLQLLETQKQLRPEQRAFLEQALGYYRQQTEGAPADEHEAYRRANALQQMGILQQRLGLRAAAEVSYRAAVQAWDRLVTAQAQVPEYRRGLAASHHNLGILLSDLERSAEAEREYHAAQREWARLVTEQSQVPEYRSDLATSHTGLGNLLLHLGKYAEAEREFRVALQEQQWLITEHAQVPDYRRDLARSHNSLAILAFDLGKPAAAETEYRTALQELERLVADHGHIHELRRLLAATHNNLGNLLRTVGKRVEAEREHRTALQQQHSLVAEHAQVPEYRSWLPAYRSNLGLVLSELGKHEEAEQEYRTALHEQQRLIDESPQVPKFHADLARMHKSLGSLLSDSQKYAEAEKEFRAALQEWARLVGEPAQVPIYRSELALTHNDFGGLLDLLKKHGEAEKEYRAALQEQERLVVEYAQVPAHHNDLAGTLVNLANLYNATNNPTEARKVLERAKPHHEFALKADPQNPTYRAYWHNNLWGMSTACHALRDHAGAVAAAQQLAGLSFSSAFDVYRSAFYIALSIPLAEKDQRVSEARRRILSASYADQAMELLRLAVARGFRDAARLKQSQAFDPLRSRADFQILIQRMEQQANAPAPGKNPKP